MCVCVCLKKCLTCTLNRSYVQIFSSYLHPLLFLFFLTLIALHAKADWLQVYIEMAFIFFRLLVEKPRFSFGDLHLGSCFVL